MIDFSTSKGYAEINYTNEDTVNSRGFKTLKTNHTSASAVIQWNSLNSEKDGVMGLLFNETENKDGSYNFILVGIRASTENFQYYVSEFKNVKRSDIGEAVAFKANGTPLSGTDANKDASSTDTYDNYEGPAEKMLVAGNATDSYFVVDSNSVSTYKVSGTDSYAVVIDVTANDDGTYDIDFYTVEDAFPSAESADDITNKSAVADSASAKVKAASGIQGYNKNGEAYKKATQANCGVYACVYKKTDTATHTLSGAWQLFDIVHSDEVVELEWDAEVNNLRK